MLGGCAGGTRNRGDRALAQRRQQRHSRGAIGISLPEAMIKVKDEITVRF